MTVQQLAEDIKKLTPKQRRRLFKILDVPEPEGVIYRGGKDDPLSRLIGLAEGPPDGSATYENDLYGGEHGPF